LFFTVALILSVKKLELYKKYYTAIQLTCAAVFGVCNIIEAIFAPPNNVPVAFSRMILSIMYTQTLVGLRYL
jgi:hypothetical protein